MIALRRFRDVGDVARRGHCAGCGLCQSLAGPDRVRMELSAAGHLRPRLRGDLPPGLSAKLLQVCPGVTLAAPGGDAPVDRIWGPVAEARRGHATDAEIRRLGSSGGVLTAAACHLLETGAVEAVILTAADPDDPVANRRVVATDPATVRAAAGSRYAPSAPLAGIEADIAPFRRIAVIAKPCDVAALRALARSDPATGARIAYLLSFFCAGVPSLGGAEAVLAEMGVARDDLAAFRYRGDGWPGRATAVTRDGTRVSRSYHETWGRILNRHLQFRCKICPDGTGEAADLVAFDAWETRDGYPDFEDRPGLSGILARTDKGQRLLDDMHVADRVASEPLPIARIAAMQPFQRARKGTALARLIAVFAVRGTWPRFRGQRLVVNAVAFWRGALRDMRGTWRRCRAGGDLEE